MTTSTPLTRAVSVTCASASAAASKPPNGLTSTATVRPSMVAAPTLAEATVIRSTRGL